MDNNKIERIGSAVLCVVGIVSVVDTFLYQFLAIGEEQKNLSLGYCVAFILMSAKFPGILKKKYVVIPLYAMILQTFYSLYLRFF